VLIATKVLAKKGKTVIPGENSAKVGKTISLKLHHITLNKLGKCL
jgi:RNA:NAD 2'-phosphotransferase (TPT1/KptA family)